jgi:hypothetical protein
MLYTIILVVGCIWAVIVILGLCEWLMMKGDKK